MSQWQGHLLSCCGQLKSNLQVSGGHHSGHDEHDEKGEMAEGGDEGVVQAHPVRQPRHDDKDSKGLDISFSSNAWVLYSFEPFLSLCHLGHINSSVILCQPSHLKKKDEKTRVT